MFLFKNGTFELKSETGTTIIERKGNTQIEKSNGFNYYSDVEWITDYKYELKNHRNHKGEPEKEELNSIYTVEILKMTKDSVRTKLISNYSDQSLERTLKIIKLK
ncbi:hypothetical protein BZARG_82 [Bizionia argentinensis JUB59]|uniref:Uncharacterized protein n=1 Tax=Bizionia argentinensis JUB59 TaxID=1046627 RepID=G2E971_9FLAO|nr:hypothetical protein [Bizionia argentinensis]EGV45032.1 hypothetical protein BZARG_82 [Bizionia argentinensis JUB59]